MAAMVQLTRQHQLLVALQQVHTGVCRVTVDWRGMVLQQVLLMLQQHQQQLATGTLLAQLMVRT